MKATGIVRRIDDLGRVVIPKEIRRTMRIREGDPLEIFTNRDGEVIFKKYSPIGELGEFAGQYAESLAKTSNLPACITDRDTVIAVSGASRKEILEKPVSTELERLMGNKATYAKKVGETKLISLIEGNDKHYASVVCPIVADGDCLGSVVFFSDEKAVSSEAEEKLAQVAANFFARHMEN